VPKEFGGPGYGALAWWVIEEETNHALIGDRHMTRGPSAGPSGMLYELNEEQKQRYLWPVLRGEKHSGFFGQTEPNAGSDPASMETNARREGDFYIINGQKTFMGGSATSHREWHFGVLLATVDRSKGRMGVTAFLVDKDTPGFRVGRDIWTIGGQVQCDLHFEDARVPVANRVGEEGQGFGLGQRWLVATRFSSGASAVGIAERALQMSINYAKRRVTFGQPIANRQAIQWMLADTALEVHLTRIAGWHGCWKTDTGQDARQESSFMRWYAAEMVGRALDKAIQVHGSYGMTKDLPLQKMWRSVRHMRIGHGTTEIEKFIVARNLLRD
jgi:acyl-CoA dehydrogenase